MNSKERDNLFNHLLSLKKTEITKVLYGITREKESLERFIANPYNINSAKKQVLHHNDVIEVVNQVLDNWKHSSPKRRKANKKFKSWTGPNIPKQRTSHLKRETKK